ncbi:hypothetical protein JYG34_02645 [Pseudomonas entomophila]|uniref:hypothetical protein n=1 Tax=Pseudomonas entomophila TaxID=312306 RepID=UPI001BCD5D1F|nr:hypothetical protein JYG34_02645 [Pseudomonas entomophila]
MAAHVRADQTARHLATPLQQRLVEAGLLTQQPASDGRACKEYVLTEKGRPVFPIMDGLWARVIAIGELYGIRERFAGQGQDRSWTAGLPANLT